MKDLPIRTNHSGGGRRWHTLSKDPDDFTEAMNAHGGVLVRTRVESTEWVTEETKTASMGLGLVFVERCQVGQRWSISVVEPDPDEGTTGHILLQRERALVGSLTLAEQEGGLLRGQKFRWYSADEPMPRPTDSQVLAVVEGRPAKSDADALREQVADLRVQLMREKAADDLKRQVVLALAQRDYLLGPEAADERSAWSAAVADDDPKHLRKNLLHWVTVNADEIGLVDIDGLVDELMPGGEG